MARAALLLPLAAANPCPNPAYAPWPARRYGFLSLESPNIEEPNSLDLLRGLKMLEIGGPTPNTNAYDLVASADNVLQHNRTRYFAAFARAEADDVGTTPDVAVDGAPFAPRDEILGKTFLRHGARLTEIADGAYVRRAIFRGDESRRRRGRDDGDSSGELRRRRGRDDGYSSDELRRRRGRDVEIPWRRDAATPRPRRWIFL